jgi:hypothetical protein
MAVKANLKIQLFANDVVVAESDDKNLWRRVLAAMQGATELPENEEEELQDNGSGRSTGGRSAKGAAGLAKELGVTVTQIVGACGPSADAPYLALDRKCWETFKRNTAARGPSAVSATQLAGTVLCLWFEHGGVEGRPTQAQAKEVLNALGASDKNSSRSIKNCAWLQGRGGGIQINPAEISKAQAVARAFVLKQKVEKLK